jgi:hypothetical protein
VNFPPCIENIEKPNLNTKLRKGINVLAISTVGKNSRRNLASKKEKKECENNFEVPSLLESSASASSIDINAIAAEDQHSFNIFREKIKYVYFLYFLLTLESKFNFIPALIKKNFFFSIALSFRFFTFFC